MLVEKTKKALLRCIVKTKWAYIEESDDTLMVEETLDEKILTRGRRAKTEQNCVKSF